MGDVGKWLSAALEDPAVCEEMKSDIRSWFSGSSAALNDIAAERRRQIEVEGWSLKHDDTHSAGEMSRAAASYALSAGPEKVSDLSLIHKLWPWDWSWFKPRSKRNDLVRAGALIIAEIERLDRAPMRTANRGKR